MIALCFNVLMMLSSFGVIRMPFHSYWTSILVNGILALIAWPLSWLLPNRRNLDGLTVWTQR